MFRLICCLAFFLVVQSSPVDNDVKLFKNGHQIFAWEKGMVVHEVLTTDIADGLVLIKMPSHNGLDAMHIVTDFKNGWTMRKFVDKNQCHLAQLDTTQFSPPQIIEETFQNVPLETYLWQNVPNITTSYVVEDQLMDLSFLKNPKVKNFCGDWPVYMTRVVGKRPGIAEIYNYGIEIMPASFTPHRVRRQLIFDDCPNSKRKSACILTNNYCHYIMTCERETNKETNFDESKCERKHEYGEARCCTSCCTSKDQSNELSPYCKDLKVKDIKCYDKSKGEFING